MTEVDSPEVRPAKTFLEGWWAFLKCEHVRPRGGTPAERAAERKQELSHLQLTDDQATLFQLVGVLALIPLPLTVAIVFDDWFAQHGILIGKFNGNWQGLAVSLVMMFASHFVVSFGMALVWLYVRQPRSRMSVPPGSN